MFARSISCDVFPFPSQGAQLMRRIMEGVLSHWSAIAKDMKESRLGKHAMMLHRSGMAGENLSMRARARLPLGEACETCTHKE